MAVSSRRSSGPVLRSGSPSGRYSSASSQSSSASAFASSSSSFSSRFAGSFHRSASPTRVSLSGGASPSLRWYSLDRPISPSRSISVASRNQTVRRHGTAMPAASGPRRTCMCSPTTHPGSFRCSLHKNASSHPGPYPSNRLNARRSAMTNSLVRIGTVEGDLVKRALAALIRPSSHQQRRRSSFHPRPSRLSSMTRAEDL